MSEDAPRLNRVRSEAEALMNEDAHPVTGWRSWLHRILHFWLMVWRSFNRNRGPVRASALAYATLLALIPMLAVVVSVTSTFLKKEGESRIDEFIERFVSSVTPPALLSTNLVSVETNVMVTVSNVTEITAESGSPEIRGTGTNVLEITQRSTGTNTAVLPAFLQHKDAVQARKTVARNINQFIQNTRSGTLGLTGSVLLIFVAISMLSRIEDTFNDIWGVVKGRSWFMKVVLYWGVITLAPMLLIVALGLATGPHLEGTRRFLLFSPLLSSLTFRVLPIVVLSVTFALFYMLMPNTRVHWRAAFVGGAVSGILFHLNNLISVLYVSRVVSNSRIYGSLGLVPVFMVGLYFSWLIVLFGAQVAYAWQNRATYLESRQVENINQRGREFVALRLLTCIGQRFDAGERAPTVNSMSRELAVPSALARQVLQTLMAARLVVETAGPETGYLPARPLDQISCHDVLQAMRATHGHELATRDEPVRAEVYGEFQRIQEAERQAASQVSMHTLATRARARQLQAPSPGPEARTI